MRHASLEASPGSVMGVTRALINFAFGTVLRVAPPAAPAPRGVTRPGFSCGPPRLCRRHGWLGRELSRREPLVLQLFHVFMIRREIYFTLSSTPASSTSESTSIEASSTSEFTSINWVGFGSCQTHNVKATPPCSQLPTCTRELPPARITTY